MTLNIMDKTGFSILFLLFKILRIQCNNIKNRSNLFYLQSLATVCVDNRALIVAYFQFTFFVNGEK